MKREGTAYNHALRIYHHGIHNFDDFLIALYGVCLQYPSRQPPNVPTAYSPFDLLLEASREFHRGGPLRFMMFLKDLKDTPAWRDAMASAISTDELWRRITR